MGGCCIPQHYVYILVIAIMNLGFIFLGALYPLGVMNIIIVGTPHYRDTLFVLIRVFCCKFVKVDVTGGDRSSEVRTIGAVIPAYKEDPEEVEDTLRSIGAQHNEKVRICMMLVSDGFLTYHEILDDLSEVVSFPYTTYKRKENVCTVLMGFYKGETPVLVFKKRDNAGKKDSLVLMDDVLIKPKSHLVQVRDEILKALKWADMDFMFHTDADSIISENTFERMSNALMANEKLAAVSGLVLVPFERFRVTGYWNLFQGFQYYYGQVIRKASESMWGKTTCIPGCIAMVNAKHPAIVQACDRYNKLPSKDFIFQFKNRLQGTDRRYTNTVMQYSKDTYLVLDQGSKAYTMPPASFKHFRSQRKRWTSNAITGNWFIVFGSNIPWYTRVLCAIDLFRIHTSITRFVNTVQFFIALGMTGTLHEMQVYMIIVVLAVPYLFFLATAIKYKKYGFFLFVGSIVSKLTSPFITIYVFTYALYYFNDLSWGKTHGSQPTTQALQPAGSVDPKDLEQGDVNAGDATNAAADRQEEDEDQDDDDYDDAINENFVF